jgi:hypothetical protein
VTHNSYCILSPPFFPTLNETIVSTQLSTDTEKNKIKSKSKEKRRKQTLGYLSIIFLYLELKLRYQMYWQNGRFIPQALCSSYRTRSIPKKCTQY